MRDVPITSAQQFVYSVIEQVGPEAPALYVTASVLIKGPVDIERFQRATAILADRIPILRAVLEVKQGSPVQRLGKGGPVLQVAEESSADERLASSILSKKADEPINVFTGSPLRIFILTTGPDRTFLLLVGHHLFLDATALFTTLGEYLRIYADVAERGRSVIAGSDSNPDYFEYAELEQKMMLDGTYESYSRFWLRELENADPGLHFRGRGRDPEIEAPVFMPFRIGQELFAAMGEHAARAGVSIFTIISNSILHTLWEFVVQESLVLAVVSDTRRPPFHKTVGQFADIFVICQSKYDRGLDVRALRLLANKLQGAMVNRVPGTYFRKDLPWLQERVTKGNTRSDLFINYLPKVVRVEGLSKILGCEITPFPLLDRSVGEKSRFCGSVMGFNLWPGAPGKAPLSGTIRYDSGVVKDSVARAIKDLWMNNLGQLELLVS